MGQPGKIPTFNVFLTVFLSFITCGIYVPIWFLLRRSWLNSLSAEQKLSAAPAVLVLVMYIISLLFIPTELLLQNSDVEQLLDIADKFLTLIGTIIIIALAFRVRSIIDWHYNYNKSMNIPINAVLTFFFTLFYLQYKINRLPES